MTRYLLLQVEDVFQLSDSMLVAIPDFSPVSLLKKGELNAWVKTPDGAELACSVLLQRAHHNSPETDQAKRRWRLVPILQGITKGQIPIGSALMIEDASVARALNLPILENYGPYYETPQEGEISQPAERTDADLLPVEPPPPPSQTNIHAQNKQPIEKPVPIDAQQSDPLEDPGLKDEELNDTGPVIAAKEPSLVKRLDQVHGDTSPKIAAAEHSLIEKLNRAFETTNATIAATEPPLVKRLDRARAEEDAEPADSKPVTGQTPLLPRYRYELTEASPRSEGKSLSDRMAVLAWVCGALLCFWIMLYLAAFPDIAIDQDPKRDFTERLVPSVAFGIFGIFMVLMGIRQWVKT
jgi:hypothetical protein